MEMKDFLEMRALEGNGLTPYEQVKIGYMQNKSRTSGTAIAGLVVGVGAAVAAVGMGAFACAKASEARRTAAAENAGTAALLKQATDFALTQIKEERGERIAGDLNITTTISDTLSGQQSGTLTATQQAELNQAQQLMFGLSTGEYSKNPQRVAIYQDAQPCPCGCNG